MQGELICCVCGGGVPDHSNWDQYFYLPAVTRDQFFSSPFDYDGKISDGSRLVGIEPSPRSYRSEIE